jgi:hypothetical protein
MNLPDNQRLLSSDEEGIVLCAILVVYGVGLSTPCPNQTLKFTKNQNSIVLLYFN